MSTTAITALILWTILVACISYVLGAFYEYDREGGSAEIHRELRGMRQENEELIEVICALTHHEPAGALPTFTHSVERSRHLFSVTHKNGGGE